MSGRHRRNRHVYHRRLTALHRVRQGQAKQLGGRKEVQLHHLPGDFRRRVGEKTLAADSPVMGDVRDAAHEISRAAQSVRSLADLLDRQPEALIKGKQP